VLPDCGLPGFLAVRREQGVSLAELLWADFLWDVHPVQVRQVISLGGSQAADSYFSPKNGG